MAETLLCTLYKLVRDSNNHADKTNGILYCNDSDDFDECVFMTSTMFRKIWGKNWSDMTQDERILPVVKLTYKGESIYRRYRQVSAKDFCDFHIGLTQRSISLLCPKESLINKNVIEVSVGENEPFFKHHPNHSTRKAYEMGDYANSIGKEANSISKESRIISYISLFFAIVSIVITFILK